MFSYIKGQLIEKGKDRAIVETAGGVGYELNIIASEQNLFPQKSEPVLLYCHLYVREDVQRLYGFLKRANRDFFRQLLGIKGLGPSMALNILSDLGAERFRKAVHEQDLDSLMTISGVGKKTARRLILELAEKLPLDPMDSGQTSDNQIVEEAVEALIGLGFGKAEASKMIRRRVEKKDYSSLEELIGDSLSTTD